MDRIYRVSGLRNAGSASIVARAITALHSNLHVRVDVEEGLVKVDGTVTDYQIASAVKGAGCDYLGRFESDA